MTPLFKKMNYKGQKSIVAINAPESFTSELEEMQKETKIVKNLNEINDITFAMVFATKQTEIDAFAKDIEQKINGDVILWFCYPKGTSKKYKCDFNRDNGWKNLAQYNLEPVRQVAIDSDWSALRFRKVKYIKTITRKESHAHTDEAKKRTTQKGK
ncbi:hypothetical protein [Flavobacterium sp.]|uniref:hypothetical protein n=1 Tax=Flavobacterium sp. TaxID=239 RepID=UPI00286E964D|nr:hypothetical protein [Flavobacterium sp.]